MSELPEFITLARLDPRHPIADLSASQRPTLHDAIAGTVREVIKQGGGYVRLMDRHALERPCLACGGEVEKIQYLGDSCYLCSNCQV
jgi:formamidopyrimidine-DNA glycosylase